MYMYHEITINQVSTVTQFPNCNNVAIGTRCSKKNEIGIDLIINFNPVVAWSVVAQSSNIG